MIGARLDSASTSNSCRLAFYGQVLTAVDDKVKFSSLSVFKVGIFTATMYWSQPY